MIPAHDPSTGNLPPGERLAERVDVVEWFGTTPWRRQLLEPLRDLFKDEVRGINRVTYDVSSKPPATIEWE